MKKFVTISAATIAAALVLAGCSAGGGSMPGMNHGSSGMSSSSAALVGDHSGDDTMFAQSMIVHHTQAVEMSDMILAKQNIPASVTALAEKIKAAQAPEIEKMTTWLQNWNESATMAAGHTMSGMMGAEDMAKLEQAQGVEAAKLFLTQMIAHHQGAVAMSKTEAAAGKNPDAVALAQSIVTSQETEIQEMKDLLAGL
ncbi:DUF305 domain-containing protein [Paenarthrobacter sp. NPDC092416]|jgi:uncharacterized protein (DUF305 family)|uniref:DUF305 domain-containing protein n=1 Tax=Paenarthrobacter sp. NPDC092416 TaxID=3364386 RepID=UPI00382334B5